MEICLNQALTPEQILALDAQALVISSGGMPRKPRLPDAGKIPVLSCEEALRGKKPLGRKLLLLGGDLIACETALWLQEQGLSASIVCSAPELLTADADPVPQGNRDMLLGLLKRTQFPVYTDAQITAMADDAAVIEAGGRSVELPCNMILYSLPPQPDRSLFRQVYENSQNPVFLAGEAGGSGSILTAIRDGSAIGAIV